MRRRSPARSQVRSRVTGVGVGSPLKETSTSGRQIADRIKTVLFLADETDNN